MGKFRGKVIGDPEEAAGLLDENHRRVNVLAGAGGRGWYDSIQNHVGSLKESW